MSSSGIPSPAAPTKPLKAHSCVLCAQRKVKCDKTVPCTNCVKAGVECIPSVPVRPRRRRRPLAQEDLLARLKHYEALLAGYGAKQEDFDSWESKIGKILPVDLRSPSETQNTQQGDVSHVQGSNLWVNLSEELLEGSSDDGEINETIPGAASVYTFLEGESIILDSLPPGSNLKDLHPPPVRIFQLWQIFIDNVNPLAKVIHVPTVQPQILQASADLGQISASLEALMFAVYSVSVNSMTDSDCVSMMDEHKPILLSRYHGATQQALINCQFLKSLNFTVLQSFVLFLFSIRHNHDYHAMWILTGVAIRMGQRLKIHSEACLEMLPAFDAEMRRRLCWQIVFLESRAAELSGVGQSVMFQFWDTKVPRNLNDGDLYPDMKELPKEHLGTTEMIFCLMRYELGEFMRHSVTMAAYGSSWQVLTSHTVSLAEKDKIVDEYENLIERKYFPVLDPEIPLHLLTIGVARASIGRLRLMCHHPRQYPDRGVNMAQSEKENLFSICLMMMEWDNRGHSTKSLQKFMWHIHFHFQSDALVYLLSELRYHGTGEQADRAWPQILDVFKNHPEILTNTKNPLWVAVGNLTLKSWGVRERDFARQSQLPPEGMSPHAINVFRSQRVKPADQKTTSIPLNYHDGPVSQNKGIETFSDQSSSFDAILPVDGDMSMDMSPIDWSYWNELIKESEIIGVPPFEELYE